LVTDKKKYINIDELTYLDERYDVTYQSKQSYYELLSAAKLAGRNHRRSTQGSELVKKKREEIVDFLSQHPLKLRLGSWLCFCRRVPSDGRYGYVWVRQIPELKFPLKNIKDRQTYLEH